MMNKELIERYGLFYVLIILVVASRLLPHPANITPVAALGLFSGAYIMHKQAWLVPLIALFISDLFIGLYTPVVMLSVYLSFAISAILGRYGLVENHNVIRLGLVASSSATVLFILSNLAVWLEGLYYPMTMSGLIECFTKAIPFYGYSLVGDLFYTIVIFTLYHNMKQLLLKRNESLHIA